MTHALRKLSAQVASDGGDENSVEYHRPYVSPLESLHVQQVLASGHMRSGGPFAKKVRRQLADLTGAAEVFLTGSCTAALELVALSLNLGSDDEVIVPSFTFPGTATAFSRTGAKIVICDVDPSTMMMDVEQVKKVATPRTKVIVPVHYAGHSVPMEPLLQLAETNNWYVVEDAAQGLGATRNGAALGTMGHFGAYSFHETKIAHCGHGGALIVNRCDEQTMQRLETCAHRGTNFASFRSNGSSHYEWTGQGSSFDLSDLQAAILTAQLADLPEILQSRLKIVETYSKLMEQYGIAYLKADAQSSGNGHIFALIADTPEIARQLIEKGGQLDLGLQFHYKPLHMSPIGKSMEYRVSDCANAANMWDRLVRLPIHTQLSLDDVHLVVDHVLKTLKK